LGADAFRTAWYSHHFFDCNSKIIGPDYSVDLDLKEATPQLFEEPGLSGWTMPLRDFARVKQHGDSINVQMQRFVGDGTRIKAEFLKDPASKGGFTLKGCGVSLTEHIPEVNPIDNDGAVSMYGFNLYIEKSTFSPEPQILIHLQGGATTSWTQRIVFEDMVSALEETPLESFGLKSLGISLVPSKKMSVMNHVGGMVLVVAAACVLAMVAQRCKSRRSEYTRIGDCQRAGDMQDELEHGRHPFRSLASDWSRNVCWT
jgi:hypothetical protein